MAVLAMPKATLPKEVLQWLCEQPWWAAGQLPAGRVFLRTFEKASAPMAPTYAVSHRKLRCPTSRRTQRGILVIELTYSKRDMSDMSMRFRDLDADIS